MFKFPVGAEVAFKQQCNRGETHRRIGTILTTVTCYLGEAYVIQCETSDGLGASVWVLPDMDIIGRVNVRTKKNGAE